MPENKIVNSSHSVRELRLISSGTKIFNQLAMFIAIGILPVIFPNWIVINNKIIVLVIVSLGLITSIAFEAITIFLSKKGKDITAVVNLQLITSVVLLTGFLHYFGHINGPFFVLYLLTIMESFLNNNIAFPNLIVFSMIIATIFEFVFLNITGELVFSFMSILELIIRIVSIVFMRSYGRSLAKNILAERQAKEESQNWAKQLEEANIKLKNLDLMKDEFLSIASHDLRTPITAIKSYLWMALNKNKTVIDEQVKSYLEIAYNSTDRLIKIVRDMFNVSRIESGKMIFTLVFFDLKKTVEDLKNEFQVKAGEIGLHLEITYVNELKKVYADKDKIYQVFENLIGNAFKFTPRGGTVNIRLTQFDDWVKVDIIDTGRGISHNDFPKLFKKFGRLSDIAGSLSDLSGTGLGLYICKQFVEQNKGRIWVESELGKGTTFSFTIPTVNGELKQVEVGAG